MSLAFWGKKVWNNPQFRQCGLRYREIKRNAHSLGKGREAQSCFLGGLEDDIKGIESVLQDGFEGVKSLWSGSGQCCTLWRGEKQAGWVAFLLFQYDGFERGSPRRHTTHTYFRVFIAFCCISALRRGFHSFLLEAASFFPFLPSSSWINTTLACLSCSKFCLNENSWIIVILSCNNHEPDYKEPNPIVPPALLQRSWNGYCCIWQCVDVEVFSV